MDFPHDPDFVQSELLRRVPGYPVVVYSGYSVSRQRAVVYKVIEDTKVNEVNVARVMREAKIMLGLKSPNICEVMELKRIVAAGTTYQCIVMERLAKDWAAEIYEKALAGEHFEEAVLVGRMFILISTLAHMQTLEIAHRDIKPENIFLTLDQPPHIKLADFDSCKAEFTLSSRSTLQGTVPYLSPKLYEAHKRNQFNAVHNLFKSDVYSLASTIVHAGQLRIPEMGLRNIAKTGVIDRLPYSPNLQNMLKWMLAEEEDDRPDFLSLAERLEIIPSLTVSVPYLNSHPDCPKCHYKCGSVPYIQLPCYHIWTYCSKACMEQGVAEGRECGFISCFICTQRYRYRDLEAAVPRLRDLFGYRQ